MPAIKNYTITRTQEIEVRSTNAHDAMKVAEAFLDGNAISSEFGHPIVPTLKLRELSAKEH